MAVVATDQCTLAVSVDVESVQTWYMQVAASESAPAKPTVADPTSLGWATFEPGFDAANSKKLYTCQKTTLTDGTFMWGAVQLSSSYTGASTALNTANAAATAASNAEKVATNYITALSGNGIWVTPDDAKPNSSGAAVSGTTSGWHIADAIELFRLGVSHIKMWVENSVAKLRLGAANSTHVVIDTDSLDIEDGSSNVLATFGANGIELGKSDGARAYFTGNYMMLVDSRYNGFLEITDYNYQYQDYDYSRKHFTLGSRGNAGQRGRFSIAIGNSNDATGDVSIAAGEGAASSGSYSSVIGGQQNTASSSYATTLGGFNNVASGQYSLAFGNNNTSIGSYSIAGGRGSASSGFFSIAVGDSAIASDSGEVAIGDHVSTGGYANFVIGSYNVIPTGPSQFKSFIIGNGTSDSRSNALSVDYSGNIVAGNTVTLGTHTTGEENGIRLLGGGTRNAWVLRTISATNGDGDAVLLGDGGLTIVGAGESAPNLWTALGVSAGTETLHLAADSSAFIHSNCNTVADRYTWEFNTAGNLSGPDGGSYVANNGQFYADSDGLTSGTHPSSETAGKGVILRDSSNAIIGVIQPRFGTSSQKWQALRIYSQRKIGTADKYNILDLRVDDSGNQVVYTNNAAAWRTALGLGTAATHADTDYADASHSHSEYFSDQVNRTANTVLAAPNGSAGHASFRRLAMADLVSSFHHNTSHANIPVVTTAPTAVNTSNWNYEVYSDGEVHAWGTFMRTVTLTTKLGDGFYWNSTLLYLALPVKAKFIQSVNYSMSLGGSGGAGAYCMPGGSAHTVWSGATFYLPFYIARPISTASQSYWFTVDVWYMKA